MSATPTPITEGESYPATEGYPAGWIHCQIHLDPAKGTMHSDGDHRVRHWIEKRISDADESWKRRDAIINTLNQNNAGLEADLAAVRQQLATAAADKRRLVEALKYIRDYRAPMGQSFTDWFNHITKHADECLAALAAETKPES